VTWHLTLLNIAVFVQVALTAAVYLRLWALRLRQVRERRVRLKDIALSDDPWDLPAQKAARNLANQFELPVLFYVAALLALAQDAAGPVFAVLMALFAASRIVHALIHVTGNNVPRRFFAFVAGFVLLLAAWLVLGLTLLA
jgi:hypothetical protein